MAQDSQNKAPRISKAPPLPLVFLTEVMGSFFSTTPVVLGWGAALLANRYFWTEAGSAWTWQMLACLALTPWIAAMGLIATIRILRLLIPKVKPGVYSMGLNRGMMSWYLHMLLNRAARISGLWPMISSSYILKYLYFRAMGARIAFGINSSLEISLVDLPLISVGRGCTLADGVALSCHTFIGDRLMVKGVEIGNQVFIGMECMIGPGTRIGDGCWLGIGNRLARETLPPGTRVDNFEWEHGSPRMNPKAQQRSDSGNVAAAVDAPAIPK